MKTQLPSFSRMAPNEELQYSRIVHLLLHFQWIWVGLITPDDENGGKCIQRLMPMLSQNGICSPLNEKVATLSQGIDAFSSSDLHWDKATQIISSIIKVYIVIGSHSTTVWLTSLIYLYPLFQGIRNLSVSRVCIFTVQWMFAKEPMNKAYDIQHFDGALSFAIQSNEVPRFA